MEIKIRLLITTSDILDKLRNWYLGLSVLHLLLLLNFGPMVEMWLLQVCFTGINLEDAQPNLAELASLPYSRGWATYSDILSVFSIVIPRNYQQYLCKQFLFSQNQTLEFLAYIMFSAFFVFFGLNCFDCVNSHCLFLGRF